MPVVLWNAAVNELVSLYPTVNPISVTEDAGSPTGAWRVRCGD